MSSNSTTYKLRLYNEILRANVIIKSLYFNYETKDRKCLIILDLNLKYAKYI